MVIYNYHRMRMHNPKNPSEKIVIPARKQPSFTSGAQLKKDLNA